MLTKLQLTCINGRLKSLPWWQYWAWRQCSSAAVAHGGGSRCPTFIEAEINNFLSIMSKVVPVGLMEWEVVAERHREVFGMKMLHLCGASLMPVQIYPLYPATKAFQHMLQWPMMCCAILKSRLQ